MAYTVATAMGFPASAGSSIRDSCLIVNTMSCNSSDANSFVAAAEASPNSSTSVSGVESLPVTRDRWMSNEEIAGILLSSEIHREWQTEEVTMRPRSGTVILYNRSKTKYRRDGYTWKKRKDGKTTREDHMKLKVNGVEFIYGSYVHSAVLSTFHRRSYWLLKNPDIVLVHYLNAPMTSNGEGVHQSQQVQDALGVWNELTDDSGSKDKLVCTREEALAELRSMFFGDDDGRIAGLSFNGGEETNDTNDEAIFADLLNRALAASNNSKPMISSRSSNSLLTSSGSSGGQRRKSDTSAPVKPNSQVQRERALAPAPSPSPSTSLQAVAPLKQQAAFFVLKNVAQSEVANPLPVNVGGNSGNLGCDVSSIPVGVSSVNIDNSPSASVFHPFGNLEDLTGTDASSLFGVDLFGASHDDDDGRQNDVLLSFGDVLAGVDYPLLTPGGPAGESDCHQQGMFSHGNARDVAQNDTSSLAHENSADRDQTPSDPVTAGGLENPDQTNQTASTVQSTMDYRVGTATITDFSPESSPSTGGVKILVTGPWYSATCPYSIVFGNVSVPAALVQSGVLRCFTPGHAPGKVLMRVACEGFVISNGMEFVFEDHPDNRTSSSAGPCVSSMPTASTSSGPGLSQQCGSSLGIAGRQGSCYGENSDEEPDETLILQLVEKLEALEKSLESDAGGSSSSSERSTLMEEALVNVCKSLMTRQWASSAKDNASVTSISNSQRKSLLHIAASLGYTKLACALLHWTAERPSRILNVEVDALRCDASGSTPLMAACKRGQRDAALLLYQWNRAALHHRHPADGASAIEVAMRAGHFDIANEIQRLEKRREASFGASSVAGSSSGSSSNTAPGYRSKERSDGEFRRPADPRVVNAKASCEEHGVRHRQSSLDSPMSGCSGANGRHVFHQWLTKRPSVDSGVCMPCGKHAGCGQNDGCGNSGHGTCWTSRVSPRMRQTRCSGACGNDGHMMASVDGGSHLHPSQQQMCHGGSCLRRGGSLSLPCGSSNNPCHSSDNALGLSFESDVLSCVSNHSQRSTRGDSLSACGSGICGGVGSGCPDAVSPFSSFMDSESFADLEVGSDEEPDAKLCAMDLSSFDDPSDGQYHRSIPLQHRGSFSHCDLSGADGMSGENEEKVFLLAEQIIAALPERIKQQERMESMMPNYSDCDGRGDRHDHRSSRCCGPRTPISWSSSPPSVCVCSSNRTRSWACTCHSGTAYPSATMADFSEFFQASSLTLGCERDFSRLTLSDQEQRELYEAACVIQKAYRSYKGRVKQKEEQDKELCAAIVIQNYYRRYKQYAYQKQVTRAAKVIQTKFRNYCKWKHCGDDGGRMADQGQSGDGNMMPSNAVQSPNEADFMMFGSRGFFQCASREGTPTSLKRTISQRRQHQAAKKIQQFMRQSKNKLQRERAMQAAERGNSLLQASAMLDKQSLQQCCHPQQRRQQLLAASRAHLQQKPGQPPCL